MSVSSSFVVAAAVNGTCVSACVDPTQLLSSISYRFFSSSPSIIPSTSTTATPSSACSVLVAAPNGCYLNFAYLRVVVRDEYDLVLGCDWLVGIGLSHPTTFIPDPPSSPRLLSGFEWLSTSLSECFSFHVHCRQLMLLLQAML